MAITNERAEALEESETAPTSDENDDDYHDDDLLMLGGGDEEEQVHPYVAQATQAQRDPTDEELRELRRKLACFAADHDVSACGSHNCYRNTTYLLAQGFLLPGRPEVGQLCFTPALVWAAAWGSFQAIPELDLPCLQQLITRHAGAAADPAGIQVDQFLKAFRQAIAIIASDQQRKRDDRRQTEGAEHSQVEPVEVNARFVPPDHDDQHRPGDGGGHATDPPGPPGNGEGDTGTQQQAHGPADLERLLKAFLSSVQNSSHNGTAAAVHQHMNVSVENKIAASNVFYGYTTPGKEDFGLWQKEFDDRAARLGWNDRMYVMQYITAWGGPAKAHLRAMQSMVEFTSQARMFVDDRKALVAWASKLYGASADSFVVNFRDLDVQGRNEAITPCYFRSLAEKQRFFKIHHEFLSKQITPLITFLHEGEMRIHDDEVSFTDADSLIVGHRRREVLQRFPEAQRLIAHPAFRNLIASWRVEDKQEGFRVASAANWEQYMKLEQWVDVNFRIPDGMYHKEARLEAYKVRDEWFSKVNLRGKAGFKAIGDMLQRLRMIDDRIRGALTIYNTRSVAAVEMEDAQIDKVDLGKKKFKKRGKHVRIAEVDSHDEEEELGDRADTARVAAVQKKPWRFHATAPRCTICRSRTHETAAHSTSSPRAFPAAGRR